MKPFRITSLVFFILAFAVTEPVLAFCPDQPPVGLRCCNFDDTLDLPAAFSSAGFLTGSGIVSNRIPSDEQAYSIEGCIADASPTFRGLSSAARCPSIPELPPITTYDPPVLFTDNLGITHGTQNFRTTYRAYTAYTNPDGSLRVGVCLNPRGVASWIASLPPPPPVACLLDDMPAISATDTCTTSLEDNNGLPGSTSGCPDAPVMTRPLGEPCFREKVSTIGVTYNGPTSTIRTTTYNQHLINVWDYYWKHQWLITDPVQYEACTAKRTAVTAEMTKHGIDYRPALKSRHLTGRAFDASKTVINGMKPARIPRLLKSPTACTLGWGGGYKIPDYVHFELNVP